MRTLAGSVMLVNAGLFWFGAVQHAGIRLGPLHEPVIVPAAIVETLCGLALIWGAQEVWGRRSGGWKRALAGNLTALGGVLLGITALALGRGPRTLSNDLYHLIMLGLCGIAVTLLLTRSARAAAGRS